MNTQSKRLLVVQRVITQYRYELLEKLAPHFKTITILSSYGERTGASTAVKPFLSRANVTIKWLRSLKLRYAGESRSFLFFLYPQSVFYLMKADVVLLEGTSNLINNLYLVPLGRLLGKHIIWWDAGYSPPVRTYRRKIIDAFVAKLIHMTDKQIAYSSNANKYMKMYMGANDCSTILNTICTSFFDMIKEEIVESMRKHHFESNSIKLLYVGAVEKRKKIEELISVVAKISNKKRNFSLTIIGDGDNLDVCRTLVCDNCLDHMITFTGRLDDKAKLKPYYFSADLFVMPGDGGLALAQSLLFGLPVVCVAADGTERDYIDDQKCILNKLDELEGFLESFSSGYDRMLISSSRERLNDRYFLSSILEVLSA